MIDLLPFVADHVLVHDLVLLLLGFFVKRLLGHGHRCLLHTTPCFLLSGFWPGFRKVVAFIAHTSILGLDMLRYTDIIFLWVDVVMTLKYRAVGSMVGVELRDVVFEVHAFEVGWQLMFHWVLRYRRRHRGLRYLHHSCGDYGSRRKGRKGAPGRTIIEKTSEAKGE